MTLLVEQTCTTDGALDLTGWYDIVEVSFDITVAGTLCEYRSNTNPKRVMHVGWLALGFEFAGGPELSVEWHKYVEFEREHPIITTPITAHHLIWHIEGGSEVHVALFT